MSTENPAPGGDHPDTENKTVPPYDGRQTSGQVADKSESDKDGAKTAGASGPVADGELSQPDPDETPGGATGAPADEQPASQMPETDIDDDGVGPAHTKGTRRGEDVS